MGTQSRHHNHNSKRIRRKRKSASCKVTVTGSTSSGNNNNKVESISLNKSSVSLVKGKTTTLTATVKNAANKTVTWSSSNTGVASVNSSGKITAKKAGTATITAKSKGGKTAKCTVTVTNATSNSIKVSSLKINPSNIEIPEGETKRLSYSLNPTYASDQKVEWSSSNTKVVTVDKNGNIVAKKVGTATITVKASDGSGVKSTCSIKVVQNLFGGIYKRSQKEQLKIFDDIARGIKNSIPGLFIAGGIDFSANVLGTRVYYENEVKGGIDHDNSTVLIVKNNEMLSSFTSSGGITNVEYNFSSNQIKYSANNKKGDTTATLSAVYDMRYNTLGVEYSLETEYRYKGIFSDTVGSVTTTIGVSNVELMPPSGMSAQEYVRQQSVAIATNAEAFLSFIAKGLSDVISQPNWQQTLLTAGILLGIAVILGSIALAVA